MSTPKKYDEEIQEVSMGCTVRREKCGLCDGQTCDHVAKTVPLDVPHFAEPGAGIGNVKAVEKLTFMYVSHDTANARVRGINQDSCVIDEFCVFEDK